MKEQYYNNMNIQPEVEFLGYCIEIYREAKGLSGREVYELFRKHDILNYIWRCYGALHTTGAEYTVDDIDGIIAAKS
jgi:hypothetical protein